MANIPVISLNAGKLTPLIDVRSDTEKYSSGCRILENMIPLIYGPVTRRPGTKYLANVNDDNVKSRMVAFIYSATIAYKVEFSDQIINVYFGDSAVDTDIVSPYLEVDLFQLQFEQSADVMWIIHPSYRPRKFSRVSATEFSLDVIPFEKGPFIERNDIAEDDDVTIAVTGYTVGVATAGADGVGSFTIESATSLSSLFPANQRFYVTNSTGNDGAFTVSAANDTTYVGTTQTIYANETIADGTNDGQIMVNNGTVTLTASAATFVTGTLGHTDALFKLTHKREKTIAKGTATGTGIVGEAIDVQGSWTFTTHGNWDATVEIQRNEDGTTWETFRSYVSVIIGNKGTRNVQKSDDERGFKNYYKRKRREARPVGEGTRNIARTDIEEDNNVQYRIYVTEWVSGELNADLVVNESTQSSIFKITAVASTTSATATSIAAAPENTATKRWAEGSWSHVRGWPSAVTFFEERIVYGFTNSDQQDIWLSRTGKFENFTSGILDDSAFTITLPTADRGRWLGALEILVAGTSGGEWRIRSTVIDEALTPTNFSFKQQTSFGSADIQTIKINEAIIFVDYVARKVREFTWNDSEQKYVSPDLTALAENITSGGITSLAVQKNPDSIIWFTISNSPYLISMTYEREQNVVAFAEHPLGGDGIAESVCVTPSTSEDIITLTVKRTINSSTVRFIEEMQPRDWGSTTSAADSFFVDAGIVNTGGDTTIEVAHLEGRELAVLVDGAVQASKTVSLGIITIDKAGDRVVAGLSYGYQVSPMRPDIVTQGGTTRGSIMIVPEIVLSLFASGNVSYGDGTNQKQIDFRTIESYGSPPDLFTGDTDALAFDGGFTKDVDIVISGSSPLPCTLRAIILRTEKVGR